MKCPNCGKESRGLCVECYLRDHPIKLKKTEIPYCECGRMRVSGEWLKDPGAKLDGMIERRVQVPDRIQLKKIDVKTTDEEKHVKADIEIEGVYEKQRVRAHHTELIKKTRQACPTCSKLAGRYYEAILQYRGDGEIELDPEQVPEVNRVKGGLDYHVMSLRYARSIANRLRKQGYTTTESYKVFGQKDGKAVVRTSIALKPPRFSKGDIIEKGKDAFIVTKVNTNIETFNLSRGKPTAFPVKHGGDFTKIGDLKLVHAAVVTAKSPTEVQVMDLKTYKSHTIRQKECDLRQGDEIRIMIHKDKCLIIPEHATNQ